MTPHYLRFAIAVVSGATAACGATQPEIASAPPPPASSTTAPASASSEEHESVAQGDPTVGEGACRCSWEVKPQGVARVCRVGEQSHTGALCVRGTRPKYGTGVMLGPLPPPDLARA